MSEIIFDKPCFTRLGTKVREKSKILSKQMFPVSRKIKYVFVWKLTISPPPSKENEIIKWPILNTYDAVKISLHTLKDNFGYLFLLNILPQYKLNLREKKGNGSLVLKKNSSSFNLHSF